MIVIKKDNGDTVIEEINKQEYSFLQTALVYARRNINDGIKWRLQDDTPNHSMIENLEWQHRELSKILNTLT